MRTRQDRGVVPELPSGITRRTFLAATGGLSIAASIGPNLFDGAMGREEIVAHLDALAAAA
jgi:hypothetical protein